jgi:hypothetical protein
MMREKVLALLLVLSLCGNIYLAFFDSSPLEPLIEKVNGASLIPVSGMENSSSGNDFYVDEYGQIISFPSPPPTIIATETTPDIEGNDPFPDELTDEVDSEGDEGESPEVTPIPTSEESETVPADPQVTYTSTKYGFSLRYPRNWTVNEAVAGRTVLTLTAPVEKGCDSLNSQCYEYIASFTVEIDQKPHTLVLEDYFNKAVSLLQLEYHITTTSKSAPAILSGARSYQIEYYTHDERGNADRNFMQYYTIIDGKGYILSYFAPYSTWDNVYHHNKADAQGIVDSFSVTRTYKHA